MGVVALVAGLEQSLKDVLVLELFFIASLALAGCGVSTGLLGAGTGAAIGAIAGGTGRPGRCHQWRNRRRCRREERSLARCQSPIERHPKSAKSFPDVRAT
jgi:hypothetical protein